MIKSLDLRRLKNDAFSGYCAEIVRFVKDRLSAEDQSVAASFMAALESYSEELRKDSTTYGEQILDADAAADHAWSMMNAQINVLSEHPVAQISDAAAEVKAIFAKYGNPTQRAYAEEYSVLENLLKDLAALDSDVLKVTLLDAWHVELRQCVDHFNEVMKQKNQSKGSVDTGAVKRLRVELEAACKDLVMKLNALMVLHPSESWKALENDINALNDVRRATNKAKRTSKSNAEDK